jgi:hypothetical protein
MKNVTITLDEETARWARIEAARRDTSVSRMVAELLRDRMTREERYETEMAGFFSRQPRALKSRRARYPNREEIHDRAGLR